MINEEIIVARGYNKIYTTRHLEKKSLSTEIKPIGVHFSHLPAADLRDVVLHEVVNVRGAVRVPLQKKIPQGRVGRTKDINPRATPEGTPTAVVGHGRPEFYTIQDARRVGDPDNAITEHPVPNGSGSSNLGI